MKIVQITPGTGNFYCGLCIRDNALVTALRKLGHEVEMIPLYLPFVTDERDTSEGTPILFGGINVYLQQKSSFFRNTPRWVDSVFDSRGLLRWSAGKAGMTTPEELGELTHSTFLGMEGNQAKEVERLVDQIEHHGKPDVVLLGTGLLVGLARPIEERLRVPAICALAGEDAFLDSFPQPYRDNCWSAMGERARDVRFLIPVSHYYADVMRKRLNLPEEKVRVIWNGISLEGFESVERQNGNPVLGYLARLNRDKGFHKLVETFIFLKKERSIRDLHLIAAGTATPSDKPFIEQQRERLAREGLERDAEFHTNVSREEKIAFLSRMSVFSVPATYGESFGLYLLEAMAAGVPVVQPRSGAFPEIVEATGGGVVVDGDSPRHLGAAVDDLLSNPDKAGDLGRRGREAVFRMFGSDRMARQVADLCREAVDGRSAVS